MITRHARRRLQQRAIPEQMLPIVFSYGEEIYQKGGTYLYRLTDSSVAHIRRDLSHILNHLDSLSDSYFVESTDGKIITAGHIK